MRKLTLLIILLATAPSRCRSRCRCRKRLPHSPTHKKAFEKLKTLAGSWEGTVMGIPINFTIRAASSGTAILHEGNTEKGVPNHEITMFYVEGIVCSQPIIVTPEIRFAGRERCRRMERRSSSVS